jgi:predicted homoserine dehydrogenase-like protein
MVSEVVSLAKRDLKAGETIGGIGSAEIYHRIYTYAEARRMKAIPMGIAPRAKVLRDIPRDEALTEENTAPDTSRFIYSLRKMQDASLGEDQL